MLLCVIILIVLLLTLLAVQLSSSRETTEQILIAADDRKSLATLRDLVISSGYEGRIVSELFETDMVKRFIEEKRPKLLLIYFYLGDNKAFGLEFASYCNGHGVTAIVVIPGHQIHPAIQKLREEIREYRYTGIHLITEDRKQGIVSLIKMAMGERFPFRPYRF